MALGFVRIVLNVFGLDAEIFNIYVVDDFGDATLIESDVSRNTLIAGYDVWAEDLGSSNIIRVEAIGNCDIFRDFVINCPDPPDPIFVNNCEILINYNNGGLGKLNPFTFEIVGLPYFPTTPVGTDIAMTDEKLWLNTFSTYNNPGPGILEYDISFNPWSVNFVKFYPYPVGNTEHSGMEVIDNNTLLVGGDAVYRVDLTVDPPTFTPYLIFPRTTSVSGDIFYNRNNNLIYVTLYDNTLVIYDLDGNIVSDVPLSLGGEPFAIYGYDGEIIIITGNRRVHRLNNDLTTSHLFTLPSFVSTQINGAAQSRGCLDETSIIPTPTPTILPQEDCGISTTYNNPYGYPTTVEYDLGTATGEVTINFSGNVMPDRFIGTWDGNMVFDTGFWGSNSYNFGGFSRDTFRWSLYNKVDPILGTTYPDFINFPNDGYPSVNGNNSGSVSFLKTSETPTTLTIEVYGSRSIQNVTWTLTVLCPVEPTPTPTPT